NSIANSSPTFDVSDELATAVASPLSSTRHIRPIAAPPARRHARAADLGPSSGFCERTLVNVSRTADTIVRSRLESARASARHCATSPLDGRRIMKAFPGRLAGRLAIATGLALLGAGCGRSPDKAATQYSAVVEHYCYDCHDTAGQEAGLTLEGTKLQD